MLDAALQYCDLGYSIFPIVPGSKRPLTKNGLLDATSDAEQVERWWTEHPTANIALRTDGLIVVDIDPDAAGNPNPWLTNDEDKLRSLAVSPISLTPRGGKHFIFRQPAGTSFRNTAGRLAMNVDTRADGGYIVIPPSVLEGGKVYRWARDLALDMPPTELPEPPQWLVKMLWQDYSGESVRSNDAPAANPIPSGQRNSALTSLAGTMRRVGMSEAEIRAALLTANATRCQPPLPQNEVETIAWSIARYEADGVAVAVAENHAAQDADEDDYDEGPVDPGDLPEELLFVPGFIGDVIDFNLEGAHKPQPVLALGGALSLLATLTGRKVTDPFGTRTNLYTFGVCGTSTGKDRPRDVNKEILLSAGLDAMIGPESIGSAPGLVSIVEHQPAILLQIDEMGKYLAAMNDPRQGYLKNILTVLMKLFTSSHSIFIGDAYADLKKIKKIFQPHCCVYGTTTPEALYESLNSSSLADGFLSRVLVFEGAGDAEWREAEMVSMPDSLVTQARWWGDFKPGGNLQTQNPQPAVIGLTDEARLAFIDLNVLADEERKRLGEPLGALWPRSIEKARKLALLWACSVDAQNPVVDEAAAGWASEVVQHLTRRLAFLASRWLSENKIESNSKRISRLIEAAGANGLTRSQLLTKSRWLGARERNEIIATLCEAGEVSAVTVMTATRPRTILIHRSSR